MNDWILVRTKVSDISFSFRPIVPSHWQMQKFKKKFSVFGPWRLLYRLNCDVIPDVFVLFIFA